MAIIRANPLVTGRDDLFEQVLACRTGTMWLQRVATPSTPLLFFFVIVVLLKADFLSTEIRTNFDCIFGY